MGVDSLDQKFEWRYRDLVGRGWYFFMPGHRIILRPMSNRVEHSPLATHTAAFVHVLVLLAAGLALCYGESGNLIWRLDKKPRRRFLAALLGR
jgi:hypothetical protein